MVGISVLLAGAWKLLLKLFAKASLAIMESGENIFDKIPHYSREEEYESRGDFVSCMDLLNYELQYRESSSVAKERVRTKFCTVIDRANKRKFYLREERNEKIFVFVDSANKVIDIVVAREGIRYLSSKKRRNFDSLKPERIEGIFGKFKDDIKNQKLALAG